MDRQCKLVFGNLMYLDGNHHLMESFRARGEHQSVVFDEYIYVAKERKHSMLKSS